MIKRKKGIISVAILSILLTTAQILPVDAKVFENETTINQEVANTFDPIKVKEITKEYIVYEITAPELMNIFEDVMKEDFTEDSFKEYIYNYTIINA